jgi:hypothetical protein
MIYNHCTQMFANMRRKQHKVRLGLASVRCSTSDYQFLYIPLSKYRSIQSSVVHSYMSDDFQLVDEAYLDMRIHSFQVLHYSMHVCLVLWQWHMLPAYCIACMQCNSMQNGSQVCY